MSNERPTEKFEGSPLAAQQTPAATRSGARVLRILDGDSVATVTLSEEGPLTLGRSADAHIPIDAVSVSRAHARLHVGKTLQIEDLGSANGTTVRGVPLEPHQRIDLLPGDEIALGGVICIVQGGPRTAAAPLRALRTHEYFYERLQDECARASRAPLSIAMGDARGEAERFTVARVRSDGVAVGFEAALLAAVRPSEVVGWYGPGEYELLLAGERAARERLDAITESLARRGLAARVGAASWPRDGRDHDALIEAVDRTLRLESPDEVIASAGDVVVEDAAMRDLHRMLARVARSNISTLVLGETGTGKEVFAHLLHKLSPRAERPFRALNCAALTDTLAESELFGHEPGAFSGANKLRIGILESAGGGSVFLDEVGELPLALQAKLLRALEERKVRRVGGNEERPIDCRFIAATNRDLTRAIEEGGFRSDLLFRLNGFTLEIPALRDRPAEILPLAQRFLASAAREEGRETVPALSKEAERLLQKFRWPGNVRELRNELRRAMVLVDGELVTPQHLSTRLHAATLPPPSAGPPAAPVTAPSPAPRVEPERLPRTLDEVRPFAEVRAEADEAKAKLEREYLTRVLDLYLHNQTRAAERLGIPRGQLVALIERYKIPRPRT